MSSMLYGITLANRAMQAFQYAMLTTSHNMTNVNNPHYSRQMVDFKDGIPQLQLGTRPFFIGGGAEVAAITRVRDLFLHQRYLQTSMEENRFSALAANLKLTEAAFGELGNSHGISDYLDQFFNAFQQLGASPADASLRTVVRQAADNLARRFRTLHADLSSQATNLTAHLIAQVGQLNQLAKQLAALNSRVVEAQAMGAVPNDLLDAREAIVSQMSAIADVRTNIMPNGIMQVFLNQFTLVDQVGANDLPDSVDVERSAILVGSLEIKVSSGAMAANFETLSKLAEYRSKLDTLAANLITEVNTLHASGYALDGTTGHLLFKGTGASTFDLSDEIRQSASNIVAAASDQAGDGGIALAIAALRDARLAALGNLTFGAFYIDLVADLGSSIKSADAAYQAQSSIRQQILAQVQANSGVNLDEELANMMKYQRSYEAAARILMVFDQMILETIQMVRR